MTIVFNHPSLESENRYPKCLSNARPQPDCISNLLLKRKANEKPKRDRVKDKDFPTHLMDGAYFPLIHLPHSDNAKAMVDKMAVQVAKAVGRKNKPTEPFKAALGALIHDLLHLEGRDRDTYGYRQMKPECFTGAHISFRGYTDCIYGLHSAGFTFYEEGDPDWEGGNPFSTRTKARATLLVYAAGYGITPASLADHFEQRPPAAVIRDPIVLKTAKTFTRDGERMRFDPTHPKAMQYAYEVNVLNAYFAKQKLTNASHYAFQRVFSRGDLEGWDFSIGGRLYSVGGVNYQQVPSTKRQSILINGEASVEVDLKASHITILHYLAGVSLPDRRDIYDFGEYPRDVVKAFINATLGYSTFHKKWSKGVVDDLEENKDIDLKVYDFNAVKAATLEAVPILQTWDNSDFRWGDLQYAESESMIAAILELALVHDVPAYPLHDSLRVPVSKKELVKRVMRKSFVEHLGFEPILEEK